MDPEQDIVVSLVALLEEHGPLAASRCTSLLYKACSSTQAVVESAGGIKVLCSRHGDQVQFVADERGGTIRLPEEGNFTSCMPTKAPPPSSKLRSSPVPSHSSKAVAPGSGEQRRSQCKFFDSGKCSKGSKRPFAHRELAFETPGYCCPTCGLGPFKWSEMQEHWSRTGHWQSEEAAKAVAVANAAAEAEPEAKTTTERVWLKAKAAAEAKAKAKAAAEAKAKAATEVKAAAEAKAKSAAEAKAKAATEVKAAAEAKAKAVAEAKAAAKAKAAEAKAEAKAKSAAMVKAAAEAKAKVKAKAAEAKAKAAAEAKAVAEAKAKAAAEAKAAAKANMFDILLDCQGNCPGPEYSEPLEGPEYSEPLETRADRTAKAKPIQNPQEELPQWEHHIRAFSHACSSSEETLELSDLNAAERRQAHLLCDELGLRHESYGPKRERVIQIHKVIVNTSQSVMPSMNAAESNLSSRQKPAEALVCVTCKLRLAREHFDTPQLQKPASNRRCRECIEQEKACIRKVLFETVDRILTALMGEIDITPEELCHLVASLIEAHIRQHPQQSISSDTLFETTCAFLQVPFACYEISE